MEAELQILRQVGSMEERFRLACHAPGATFDQALTVRTSHSLQESSWLNFNSQLLNWN